MTPMGYSIWVLSITISDKIVKENERHTISQPESSDMELLGANRKGGFVMGIESWLTLVALQMCEGSWEGGEGTGVKPHAFFFFFFVWELFIENDNWVNLAARLD